MRLSEAKGPSIWTIKILQAPELLWFPKISQERAKPQVATESGGGCKVARESRRRREKDRNGERTKNTLSKIVCGFQNLMIDVGWRGEKMK